MRLKHFKFICNYFLVFVSFAAFTHDAPIAMYELKFDQTKVSLKIKVETEQLLESLHLECLAELENDRIQSYFDESCKWLINDHSIDFKPLAFNLVQEHIIIRTEANLENFHSKNLMLENTFMIDRDNHSNIIDIYYSGKRRTFRLHKERTKTSLILN